MLNAINQLGQNFQGTILQGISLFGLSQLTSAWMLLFITISAILIISNVSYFVAKYSINRILSTSFAKNYLQSDSDWFKLVFQYQVVARLTHLIPAIIIYASAPLISLAPTIFSLKIAKLYKTISLAYILITLFWASCAFLNGLENHYRNFRLANRQSIKGYFQTIEIILFILTGILVVADFLDKSPIYLLTSIGAMATILMLAFKDVLLGFVANIQIATGDLVRLGDPIKIEQYNIEGEVIDISLNQVKILNSDRSITTLPLQMLLNTSLKNMRNWQETSGRLIKRAIYIDITTIKFSNQNLLNALYKNNVISKQRFEQYSAQIIAREGCPTNLEILRDYLQQYLANHSHVQTTMSLMVNQLQGTSTGLPLELYFYVKEREELKYQMLQSSILEHVYAIVKEFDLRMFQYVSATSSHPEAFTNNNKKPINDTAAITHNH